LAVTFAPIVRLVDLAASLAETGKNEQQIKSRLETIKAQQVTDMFYLPAHGELPESVVLLGQVQSMPFEMFRDIAHPSENIFRLNDYGFYWRCPDFVDAFDESYGD
jgi:hypothetical protein